MANSDISFKSNVEELLKFFEISLSKDRNTALNSTIGKKIEPLFYEIINSYNRTIEKNTILYRGRLNKRGNKIPYPNNEMGMPDTKVISKNGRANPEGINYLYLAEDKDTVIAELRPGINCYVTIGEFKVLRDIKVLELSNCFVHSKLDIVELALDLGLKFALPVDKENIGSVYILTQYFTEITKNHDSCIEGIKYLSSVMDRKIRSAKYILDVTYGRHFNIALFEEKNTECIKTKVYQVLNNECKDEYKYEYKEI